MIAVDSAVQTKITAEKVHQAHPADEDLATSSTTAAAAVLAATSSLDDARSAFRATIVADLGSDKQDRLTRIISKPQGAVPLELRVWDCTDTQWKQLQVAIVLERRAPRAGETVQPDAAALLSEARENSDVVGAATALQNSLLAVQAIF